MWQFCSGKKWLQNCLQYDPNYIKKYIIYIQAYIGGEAINGGYFWVVILSVIIFSVLYISVFFKFSTMTMYYFIIQKNTQAIEKFL